MFHYDIGTQARLLIPGSKTVQRILFHYRKAGNRGRPSGRSTVRPKPGKGCNLDSHGLLRLSPYQPWHPWHRFQHYYAFAAYSLLTLSWVTTGDFRKFFSGHIGRHTLRQPTGAEVCFFFLAKAFYFGYALILPLFLHPWLHVLMAFVGVHLILGFTLSMAFQLAHTVEPNSFPTPDADTGMMPQAWAMHEVETTANFDTQNLWAIWYLGGLNFQIEHHLFAHVCHRHYPAISTIVAATCREFALPMCATRPSGRPWRDTIAF